MINQPPMHLCLQQATDHPCNDCRVAVAQRQLYHCDDIVTGMYRAPSHRPDTAPDTARLATHPVFGPLGDIWGLSDGHSLMIFTAVSFADRLLAE